MASNETTREKSTEKSPESSSAMTHAQMVRHLRAANDVAKEMKKFGHHPFGAVLVAPDNEQILMHQGNVSVVRHAETELSMAAVLFQCSFIAAPSWRTASRKAPRSSAPVPVTV